MRTPAYVLEEDGGAMIFVVELVKERTLVNFRLTGLAVLAYLEMRGLGRQWRGLGGREKKC